MKNKIDSKCKNYKCMFFTWYFRMNDFTISLEDKKSIQSETCNFWGVPHRDFKMKAHGIKPFKKKNDKSLNKRK